MNDSETLLAIGTATFGLLEIIKRVFPKLQDKFSNLVPLLVLMISAGIVVGGVVSGEIDDTRPLQLFFSIITQAVTTLGIRQGVVAVANTAVVPDTIAKTITGTDASTGGVK